MCGIVGGTSNRNILPILIEGLRRLEYRGYDSAGVAYKTNGKISLVKNAGRVDDLAAKLNLPFVNACIGLEIEGSVAKTIREIDGGKETAKSNLPIVIGGKKGLVEENELRIPNMRGIMTARSKPLNIHDKNEIEPISKSISFSKPHEKSEVKIISPDNLEELVRLLNEESKVI